MSEVKRFDAFTSFDDFKSRMVESKDGNYVAYSDYLSQLQQTGALQTSLNNIINAFGISGEGAHSELVIEYVHGLVAENAALKKFIVDACVIPQEFYGDNKDAADFMPATPVTDAFTAELRAQGVDELARTFNSETIEGSSMVMVAKKFAANLRAGRNG
ncbi:MAG: hypothetical protein SOI28_05595 [Rahnella inusitata]|jgi:hypothetical protein